MTAREELLSKYKDLELFKDTLTCRYTKKGKIMVKSKAYNGERHEKEAVALIREVYPLYKRREKFEKEIQEIISDVRCMYGHPKYDQIERIEAKFTYPVFISVNHLLTATLTVVPNKTSLFLPASVTVLLNNKDNVEKTIISRLLEVSFVDYAPARLGEFQPGFSEIIDGWRREMEEAGDVSADCPLFSKEESDAIKFLFSDHMKITYAKSVRKTATGIKISFGKIKLEIDEKQKLVWKAKDHIMSILGDQERLMECWNRCEAFKEEKAINNFVFENNSFVVHYSFVGNPHTLTLSPDTFPENKEALLAMFQKKHEEAIQEKKQRIIDSGCLSDVVSQCIIEIVKHNEGICSKTAICNILSGKQASSDYYTVHDDMVLKNGKISLSETESKLRGLVNLGILCAYERYGSHLGRYYDVYDLTDDLNILSLIAHQEVRTDHEFEKYNPLDWKNFILTEALEPRELKDWMSLFIMWKDDVLDAVSSEQFIDFWKNAPAPVLEYMKYTLNDQQADVKRIWKKLLKE